MRDRIPTPGQEGRVLITPESGAPYYAKIAMADNPIEKGTPNNKENLLSDETEIKIFGEAANRTVNDALARISEGWREVVRFETAGAHTWVAPFTGMIGVLVVGGGVDGGSAVITSTSSSSDSSYRAMNGGPSGYAKNVANIPVAEGQLFNVVVGDHGASGGASSFTSDDNPSLAIVANGGEPVKSWNNSGSGKADSAGGQTGRAGNGYFGTNGSDAGVWQNKNYFTGEEILGAGGGAAVHNVADYTTENSGAGGKNWAGLGGGNGSAKRRTGDAIAESATMYGCGGGSAIATSGYTATPGQGAPGVVIIYRWLGAS